MSPVAAATARGTGPGRAVDGGGKYPFCRGKLRRVAEFQGAGGQHVTEGGKLRRRWVQTTTGRSYILYTPICFGILRARVEEV